MYPYSGFGNNPYTFSGVNSMPQYQPQQPQQNVIRVNGENGARSLNLPPRSSALALDESAPIVWLVTSDDAGYRTVKPYSITEYRPEPDIDVRSLSDRLTRLEARFDESYSECAGQTDAVRAKRQANVSGIQSRTKSGRISQPDYTEEPSPGTDRD